MEPTQVSGDTEIHVPIKTVLTRTAYRAYKECVTYFVELRDSLRNILVDIQKYEGERELMDSDAFWRKFMSKASKNKGAESQLWTSKRRSQYGM